MKYLLTLSVLVAVHMACAQQIPNLNTDNQTTAFKDVLYNIGGQNVVRYEEFKNGSPYFNENWLPASLVLNNGKIYEGLQGRLDLVSGDFIYKNEKGTELVAQAPIQQILFTDSSGHFLFVNAAVLSASNSKKLWYQQLQSGMVTLYKQSGKTIVENTPFNSATVEKSIKTTEKYFLLKGQTLIPIKKTKDLLEALNDQAAVSQKFGNQKQSLSENTLVEIVSYYNSLSK